MSPIEMSNKLRELQQMIEDMRVEIQKSETQHPHYPIALMDDFTIRVARLERIVDDLVKVGNKK